MKKKGFGWTDTSHKLDTAGRFDTLDMQKDMTGLLLPNYSQLKVFL